MIKKYGYVMPVNVIGTDAQGRTLVQCPSRGCCDTEYIAENGRLVCPTGEAIEEFLTRTIDVLDRALSIVEAHSEVPDRE